MNLVRRGSLPLKEGESYVRECTGLRSTACPIFSLHKPVIGCGCAEWNPVAFVISAQTNEAGTSGDATPKMVDVRWLQIRARRLVMAAVLIQPRYRVGIGAAVVRAEL